MGGGIFQATTSFPLFRFCLGQKQAGARLHSARMLTVIVWAEAYVDVVLLVFATIELKYVLQHCLFCD